MIRRETPDGWLLISQVDHAHLAADVASAWGNDDVTPLPLTEWLLPAIRDHDAGWRSWEAQPTLTADGLPRQFVEMTAEVATQIWTSSIATSAGGTPSLADTLRRLRSGGGEVTPDDAAICDVLAHFRQFVPLERLKTTLLRDHDMAENAIDASLQRLESKNIIRRTEQAIGGTAIEIDVPQVGTSPLGGVWVSRHFTTLAEQALESKRDSSEEDTIRRFVREQSHLQSEWLEVARALDADVRERVADTGFRYVQFFDRISLWLCMAERDEPWEATLSSNLTLRFTPRSPYEISVDPWPFNTPAIELVVTAVKLDAAPLKSDAGLLQVIANAERRMLRWVLVR
jgi:hypothetical protein